MAKRKKTFREFISIHGVTETGGLHCPIRNPNVSWGWASKLGHAKGFASMAEVKEDAERVHGKITWDNPKQKRRGNGIYGHWGPEHTADEWLAKMERERHE